MTRLNLPIELQHFKVREVCLLLSVHSNTVHDYLSEGKLEGVRLGERDVRVTASSLVRLIEEGKVKYSREKIKVGFVKTKTGPTATVKDRASKVLERLGLKS